jgi:hypothetical protein
MKILCYAVATLMTVFVAIGQPAAANNVCPKRCGHCRAGSEAADNAGPPAMPQLSQLTYFEGAWTCQEHDRPLHEGDKTNISTLQVRRTLGHSWYLFKWDTGTSNTSDFTKGHAYAGWDPGMERFVDISFSTKGGYGATASPGFDGRGALVWTGVLNNYDGAVVKVRKTYTKIDDNTFEMSIDIAKGNANCDFISVSAKMCSREPEKQ